MRHLLEIDDLSPDELHNVLAYSQLERPKPVLAGRGVALVFEKPSARTRNSAEMAVVQLGGHPVYIQGGELGFDTRESVEDITRTLAGYYDFVGARVFDHATLERMEKLQVIPIVNLLSDKAHPMQALADLLTIQKELGDLSGRTLAFVGDANNVWRSLALGAAMAGMKTRLAIPDGYGPAAADIDRIKALGAEPLVTQSPVEAVAGADVVYTDVWASMGQEGEFDKRKAAFAEYSVTADLMEQANPGAIFMHCLPAHRGEEVVGEVVDGPQSRIWPQAENRMHTTRGLLAWLWEQQ